MTIRRGSGTQTARGLRLLLVLLAAGSVGCSTLSRQGVMDTGTLRIMLLSEKSWGKTVAQGYDQPVTIAPVRLAHVLSRIDVRLDADEGMQRLAAIETDALYEVAEGLSKALTEASPDQRVSVQAIRRYKRFGVFDRKYLTSFLAYVKDDLLYVHLHHYDWKLEKRAQDRIPLPKLGDNPDNVRVVPSKGMAIVDDTSIAAAWRDDVFQKPSRTRITATGQVVRKTILMESPELEQEEEAPMALPANLSPETLRRLANLEEERLNGGVTESEYDLRRRAIIRADPASR